MHIPKWLLKSLCGFSLFIALAPALAAYPDRPVKLIIPFAPGGGTDIVGRFLAEKLGAGTGVTFVPENRPGAAAAIGANLVAKAPPDGYTLLLGTSAELTMVPNISASTPYDPLTDFTPIALIGSTPNILLAKETAPFNDIVELIAQAKANPGTLFYASGGMGPYLSGELFKYMANVTVTNVSYAGTGPATSDLLGGHVDMMVSTVPAAEPLVKTHRVKALAVTSTKRSAQLPDVPTMDEMGLKGYEATTWFGLFAPANVPQEVSQKLKAEIEKILNAKEVQEKMAKMGIELSTAENRYTLDTRMKDDLEKWKRLITQANIEAR